MGLYTLGFLRIWEFYGILMGFICGSHAISMLFPLFFYGNSVGFLWDFHDISMGLLWDFNYCIN
jgi:hypothetical protein